MSYSKEKTESLTGYTEKRAEGAEKIMTGREGIKAGNGRRTGGWKKLLLLTAAVVVMALAMPPVSYAASDGMSAFCHVHYPGIGWSTTAGDNIPVRRYGTFITALAVGLDGQPEGVSGTVSYAVYQNGVWTAPVENFAQTGNPADPIESVRIELTGALNRQYDIYYKTCSAGNWNSWKKNGEEAGSPGSGIPTEGLRVCVVSKGAGEPEDTVGGIDPARPMIALTFDDGPNAAYTERILNVLESCNARATFFMVGNRVSGANAEAVRHMAAIGCELGNHTYAHSYVSKLSADGIRDTIGMTNQKVSEACGGVTTVMRPPGGLINSASQSVLSELGYPIILWSVDTRDWKTRNTQSTVSHILSNVKDGDIILMHDLYSATAGAAEVVIPELINRGYQLVTVSELAAMRGGMVPGQIYYSFRP